MLALGLADRVAGTSNLRTKVAPEYQTDYATVPVLSPELLSGEQLRAAAPDFVVASFKDQYTADGVGTREELTNLDLPTFISAVECPENNDPAMTPFDLLFSDYKTLGQIFGVEDRATVLIDKQRKAVAAAAETEKQTSAKPTMLWLYSTLNGIPYVAGGKGLPTNISRLVGAKNAFDDVVEDWPEIPWERIAERNPDIVVVGDLSERGAPGDAATEKIAMIQTHPVMSQVNAVRDNKIITVPGIGMDPSVRSVDTLDLVAKRMREFGYAK